MQAIWRGAINFGLISIPVRLFSATEEKTLRFNLLHKEDDGRIRNNRTCRMNCMLLPAAPVFFTGMENA